MLVGFCGFLFFFGLAHFGLLGADEPRYAQVAREMLARHDWITPTLGGQSWLEKPILYYWQAMVAYKIFGVSDWAARLPSAIDATFMVIGIFVFLRRLRPGFELDGALITASAVGVIGFARAASMDMPLAATFTIAMLAWYAWHESQSKTCLAIFYVFVALGTLAKGPIAPFLAAVVVIAFAITRKNLKIVFRTLWIPGILLYLLAALPWYIAVQLRNPEFFRVFILEHNFSRFGTNRYHHPQPIWFYVPIVVVALLPWAIFAITALAETIRTWWAGKKAAQQSEDVFNFFLAIWFVLPVVFFSLSQSKLPGYILPAMPAGTLLLAEYMRRRNQSNKRSSLVLVILHSVMAALLPPLALILQAIVIWHRIILNPAGILAIAMTIVLSLAIGLTLRSRPGLRLLRFVTLVPVILAIAAVLRLDGHFLDERLSIRPLSESINRIDNASLPTAVFQVSREVEYGLHFYRNQPVARYESGEIPSGEHLLVAPHAVTIQEINQKLPGRRVSYLGSDQPQHLDYFWVSPPGMTMDHMKM